MKDENIKNDGIRILESMLNKWHKEKNVTSKNYIFLPKFLEDVRGFHMVFPIYEEFDQNNVKLISWIKFSLEENNLEENEIISREALLENIKNINYNDKKYSDFLELIAKIFYLSINLRRLDKTSNEYLDAKCLIKENIDAYSNLANKKGLKNCLSEDELEKYQSIKSKNNVQTKEKTDFNEVEMPDLTGNSELKIYAFEFKTLNGLRNISDDMLEIAYELIRKGQISLGIIEKNGVQKLNIVSNVVSLCKFNSTTKELSNALKRDAILEDKNIFQNELYSFNGLNLNSDIDSRCYKCSFQKCPIHVAAYILYLRNNGLLREKLIDRKLYRKNHETNDEFDFNWNIETGLKEIPEKTYNFCNELVNRKLICLDNVLSDGKIRIRSAFKCNDYKLMNEEVENIYESDGKYVSWLDRSIDSGFEYCSSYPCRLPMCTYVVAGYIYYLRRSRKDAEILADRKYYEKHKIEIDEKINKQKDNKILEIENEKENKASELREYKGVVANVDSLIGSILNRAQNNLHCVVEGEDLVERKEFITKVENLLVKSKKISQGSVIRMSLQNLASGSAFSWSGVKEEDKAITDMNGEIYKIEEAIKYPELKEGKLYVLSGISEFTKDFLVYANGGSGAYLELRKKQYNRLIELITKMRFSNYIIIEGTEAEVDKLLDLDSKIKFIYQNNRFKIPDLSLDEMYDLYMNNIKTDLIEELRNKKEEYKKQFVEWVSMNKNFVPFSDRELVNYLVMYANSKDKIVFPDNIYKKETVEESLRNIIGLQTVKDRVKEFEKYMLFKVRAQANNLDIKKTNMHMIFTGNPGTGKTTIARIMAKMLFDLGLIKENKLIEVERKDLIAEYTGQTAPKTAAVIEKAMGGVLFIDEAYTLATERGSKDFASEAIATIIKAMEDYKDKFVVIFAGYKDEMKTFVDSNPGIASRIGYKFDFPDYTSEELMEMFYLKMKNAGFVCSNDIHEPIQNICEYYSKKRDFGNGRFVDRLMQEVIMKHAISDQEDIKLITDEDIPTIEEMNNEKNQYDKLGIDQMLDNIVGLEDLKVRIKEFEKYVRFIKKARNSQINVPNQNMHMIFTGNPGTGKTTIARVIAKILFEIGIIHENKLVEVERKDLVGQYIGQTAPKTAEVIDKAMGGVLFIDEAYTLAPKGSQNDLGSEAIATLIKAMEDNKDQLIVIFAGYKDEMKTFIDSNPGIASRIGYNFDFTDYTPDELVKIFKLKIKKAGFSLDDGVLEKVKDICEYYARKKSFGNGRFVDKLMQEVIMKHAINDADRIEIITIDDVPTIEELNNSKSNYDKREINQMLDDIVGLKDLKEKIKEFEEYVKFIKDAKNSKINIPNQNLHMIFTGNPGTGKTTVARVIAKILFEIGIIHENKLVEVERKDLIGEYVGKTALKTTEVIEKAMGGVLFIDEAYSLTPKASSNDFGSEAIATLIKAMEDHKDQLIVIFAGYKEEMKDFIDSNPGIASRIGYTFDFPDYSDSELVEIYYKKASKIGIKFEEEADAKIHQIMKYFSNVENIGNGRFVDKVMQETLMKHAKNRPTNIGVIPAENIPTIKEMTEVIFNGQNMIDVTKITPEALKRTAVHEIGHAVVRMLLFKKPGIKKITINAEGTGTLGYVLHSNDSSGYTRGKTSLLNEIKTRLAGMGAEQVYFGEFENGNTSDLESATHIANLMITKFGMSDLGLGQIQRVDGEMANIVQKEINDIMKKCFDEVIELIKNNKEKMDNVVSYILEHREIDEEKLIENFR